ncbi:MAG: hypothetical protein IJS70_03785 [Bacteroidales bacterium]|nr:hypothetical protein [Bacteroidales bacterium]
MKRLLSILVLTALVVASCSKYDDSDLQRRVSALEAYQSLLQKLDSGKPVTSYSQSGTDVTFNFGDGTSITIDNKPSADNPIKTITADGNTLTITLADGNVIPVSYGEKEKFGFEIANGRRCFSILEKVEWLQSKQLKLPYTLSGDIADLNDVDIETRVTSYHGIVDSYDQVSVEKTDAKSGSLVVSMGQDSEGSGWDSGEFYYYYPEMVVDVTAHFPDGTSSYKKLYIVGFKYYLETDENTWDLAYVEYDSALRMNVIRLPKNAGEFKVILKVGTDTYTNKYFYAFYDGEPFTTFKYDDIFYNKINVYEDKNGLFLTPIIDLNQTATVNSGEGDYGSKWWDAIYTADIKFTANATGVERYNEILFWKRESPSSAGSLTRVRVIQAAH